MIKIYKEISITNNKDKEKVMKVKEEKLEAWNKIREISVENRATEYLSKERKFIHDNLTQPIVVGKGMQ